jgi:predicted phosphodiesterase
MRIGIISDTHDNMPLIKRACELFNAREVQMVLHCGDYCAPFLNPPTRSWRLWGSATTTVRKGCRIAHEATLAAEFRSASGRS